MDDIGAENWKTMITEAMGYYMESWEDVIENTLTQEDMLVEFDSGFGRPNGKPFTVWTERRVYFPVCYDEAESVTSVSRNPDMKPTPHIGGGF